MKKTWILLLILCGFAMAQRPYNERSAYAQSILYRDLHPSTQDSLRKIIGDSVAALSIDGFSLFINADNQIAQKVYADTTALKAASGDSLGSFVNLKQLSSSNTNGGGIFVYADSAAADSNLGISRFPSVIAGKHWVRQEVKDNPNFRSGNWGTLAQLYADLPDDGGVIVLPPGRYDVGTGMQLKKSKHVSFIGDDRWQRYQTSTGFDGNADYPKDAPVIYSSGNAQYFFDFNDGVFSNGVGFVFKNLVFEIDSSGTDYVINGRSVNFGIIERCLFWGTTSANVDSVYAARAYVDGAVGNDASWWRMVDNTIARMNIFKSGDEGGGANQNQHYIARNVAFGFTTDSTNSLPAIKLIGNHRSIIKDNNIEAYNKGIHVNGGWAIQSTGNAGEQTRKFVIVDGTTKGCYFNDAGRSSPNAANGDTLYIVSGTPVGNTFFAAPIGGSAYSVYDAEDFIRFNGVSADQNTIIGSTIYYPSRFTMPEVANLDPFRYYPSFTGLDYYDQIEGVQPDSIEYWNGSAWADWSGSEDFVEATLNTPDYVTIDSTHKKIRVTYPVAGRPSFLQVGYGLGTATHSVGVTVEYLNSGGTAVISKSDTSIVANAGGGFIFQCGTLSDAVTQARITLNFAIASSSVSIRLANLKLLTWNSFRSSGVRKKLFMGTDTPISYATGSYGDIYIDKTNASGFPLWVSDGSASKTAWRPVQTVDSGAALPTASIDLRGQQFLKTVGAGVKDSLFVCIKNSGDTYAWEYLGQ